MSTRFESSFPPVELRRAGPAAAAGVALFVVAWALLHVGFYDRSQIVDTPGYEAHAERILDGELPYRDFELEYPPASIPAFVLPALAPGDDYRAAFEALMLVCGACAVAALAFALAALGASPSRLYGAVAFAGLAPLALGSVLLTRYDLWPAALTVGALAALVSGRERLGFAALGLAVAAKLYPLVFLPLALMHARRRWSALAAFAAVLAAAFVPFAIVAPEGLRESIERQTGRPLQLESLGSAFLLAAHQLGAYGARVVSSHGSQNLAGGLPDAVATVQTALQALAIVGVWALFATRRGSREAFVAASAAAVAAFVAFGKVLSPQFLIWLLPLVPLVGGGAGLAAGAVLLAALVATQVWFPFRYWDLVDLQPVAWLVLVRDLLLVALFGLLVAALARRRADK